MQLTLFETPIQAANNLTLDEMCALIRSVTTRKTAWLESKPVNQRNWLHHTPQITEFEREVPRGKVLDPETFKIARLHVLDELNKQVTSKG